MKNTLETRLGLFIALAMIAGFLILQVIGDLSFFKPAFNIRARFAGIQELKVGDPVKMAGVPIGSVQAVVADPVKLDAEVTLAIDKRYNAIPDDSAAAVFTSGLIGTQYVAIQPGGSPDALKDGDEMVLTQSAMQLEDLIGKFMVNGSSGDKKDAGNGKPSESPAPAGKH